MDIAFGGRAAQLATVLDQPDPCVGRFEHAGAVADRQIQHLALVEVGGQRLSDLAQGLFVLTLHVRRRVQAGGFQSRPHLCRQQQEHPLFVRPEHSLVGVEADDQGADRPIAHHQRDGFNRLQSLCHTPPDGVRPARVVAHDDRSAEQHSLAGGALTGS